MAKTKLKVGQAVPGVDKLAESDDAVRRRENRSFLVMVIVAPIVLMIVVYAVYYLKLFG